MKEQTVSLDLLDAEAVLLDGKVRPELQPAIDAAKNRLSAVERLSNLTPERAKLVSTILEYARSNGKLRYYSVNITHCRVCGADPGYWTHTRSSRYHRRGQPNYDRPKHILGWELADSFVSIRGHVALGACAECIEAIKPTLAEELSGIQAEIPEALTGGPTKWKRWEKRKCKACGWEGHEGQMGKCMTLMGDGYFRGKCPSCSKENGFMSVVIDRVDGFVVVAAKPTDDNRKWSPMEPLDAQQESRTA